MENALNSLPVSRPQGGIRTETNPYPDAPIENSLQVGAEFLDFVMVELYKLGIILQPFTSKKMQRNKGESLQGWEVKLDNRFTETRRLSIEIAEKVVIGQQKWIPSGIYRRDNTWLYIQGNYEYFYIFSKRLLKSLHQSKYKDDEHEWKTVKKFYLPIEEADRYCIFRVVPSKPSA